MLPDSAAVSFWEKLFVKILGFGILSLAALVLFFVAVWGLQSLFRWLLSRNPQGGKRRDDFWKQINLWLAAARLCWEKLHSLIPKVVRRPWSEGNTAVKAYKRLLVWGRSCGFPCLLHETPREYGLRLATSLPVFKNEVELIVSTFNREIYGEIHLDERQSALLRQARRRLFSPLFWFLRFLPGKQFREK